MAHDTIEIFARSLSKERAADWLATLFDEFEQVRTDPIVTYEGQYEGETVSVQVAEHVENGPFTSLWFDAPDVPWDSTKACARAAHEALGVEVLCYPGPGQIGKGGGSEKAGEPWAAYRVVDGEDGFVDERKLDI